MNLDIWRKELSDWDSTESLFLVGAICGFILCPPVPHSSGKVVEDSHGSFPVDTGISDADTFFQGRGPLSWHLLVALVNVGLDHDAHDGGLAIPELVGD